MAEIKFSNIETKNAFESLSDDDPRKEALKRAFENIEENPAIGRLVDGKAKNKKGIKKLLKKHEVSSIRIYNLPSAWRLLYSVQADQIGILAIILDWMDHKDYEKIFK